MKVCPNCGGDVEDTFLFCQECGFKLKSSNNVGTIKKENNSFETKKLDVMIVFGYLTLFVQIVAILASWYHVKYINADRIILYPLLCVMLAFFTSFNLINYEKTYKHSIIIVVASVFLFILGIVAV